MMKSTRNGVPFHMCHMPYVGHMPLGTEYLAKVDINSAYRMVPVHPDDRLLLGMQWENNLYVDGTLPFGLRSAPRISTAVADALEWQARFKGTEHILYYLDDFLITAPAGNPQCSARNKLAIGHSPTNFSIWPTKIHLDWPNFLYIFNGTAINNL